MKRARQLTWLIDELSYDEAAGDRLQLGMEIAAALGSPVDFEEWRLACEDIGVAIRREWVDTLVDAGLAALRDDSWCFIDDALPAALEALAADAGRWKAHQSVCAQALYRLESVGSRGIAQRRSLHLEKAGKHEEAIESLLHAVDEISEAGNFHRLREYFERMDELFEDSEVPTDANLFARAQWRRGRFEAISGEPDTALELVQRALDVLDETNWSSECGHAELIQAQIWRREGNFEDAIHTYRDASRHFAMCGDEHGLGLSRAGHGVTLMLQAKHRLAREKLLMAVETFESQRLFGLVSELCSSVAHTWLAEGEYVYAIAYAERARDLAEQHDFVSHQAMAWNTLGEVARAVEDYEEAARCYASAVDLFERADNLNVHIARCNLALVEVARGNFATGRQRLESSVDDLRAAGLQSRLTSLFCGLMACAASEYDWDGWEVYRQKALQCVEQTSSEDADVAWAASLASEVAFKHNRKDLGTQALELF